MLQLFSYNHLMAVMPLVLPRDPPRPLDSERPLAAVRLWIGQMLAANFLVAEGAGFRSF